MKATLKQHERNIKAKGKQHENSMKAA